jgi:hypothetical protein
MGANTNDIFTRADLIEYTINVEYAGTLGTIVEAGSYSDAQKLVVTGRIKYEDVNYVDENMKTVEVLDLSGSRFEISWIDGSFLSETTNIKEILLPYNIWGIYYDWKSNTDSNGPAYFVYYPFKCNSLTSITLPNTLEHIGSYAFYGCKSLNNLYLPDGVTSIGANAFEGCSSLTNLIIPDGVTKLREAAFKGCKSLTNIKLSQSITSLEDSTFYDCSSLTSIDIPVGVTSIGSNTFEGCSALTSIDIPDGVTSIGDEAFKHCTTLTSITLPESVVSIGTSAFEGCTSLTSITFPNNVATIEQETFKGCSSLKNVTLSGNITSIENNAFIGCNALTHIILPENLITIGDNAFEGCSSLTTLEIPEGVTSIGNYAFLECNSLTSVTIPNSVTNYGLNAFADCISLTNITFQEGLKSIGTGLFSGCSSLTNITFPDGLESIEDQAFMDCSSLSCINIPESVTSISGNAFNYCKSLQKVICNTASDIGDLNSTINLYCWLIINRPDGNIPLYGPNWKNVAINGEAGNVILPYRKQVDFTIPEEVKSIKKISYTMTFEPNFNSLSYGIWRTIALPFAPTRITHAEKGTLVPFDSEMEGAMNFWLRELTPDGFKDVTQIEANHPYLIAMPYSTEYVDWYNISGDVTFSAENLTSDDFENNTPLSAVGTDYTMYASYSYMDKANGVYALNDYNQFVNNSNSVSPFEAYSKANTATMRSVISLNKGRVATRARVEGKRKPQIDDM